VGCNSETEIQLQCNTSTYNLDLQVMIEGAFDGSNINSIVNSDHIPLNQPFNISPWEYYGNENITTIPSDFVDWVLVELRDSTEAEQATGTTIRERQAAILKSNGEIVGTDGNSLSFGSPISYNLFIVIWHRNHIGIMSSNPLVDNGGTFFYNFFSTAGQSYNDGQKNINGKYVMYAGDGNSDGIINSDDNLIWKNVAGENGYFPMDINQDGQVDNTDKNNLWINNINIECQVPE